LWVGTLLLLEENGTSVYNDSDCRKPLTKTGLSSTPHHYLIGRIEQASVIDYKICYIGMQN